MFCIEEGNEESTESLYNDDAQFAQALEDTLDKYKHFMAQAKVELASLQHLWEKFVTSTGVTLSYRMIHIDMCQIPNRYIKAERSGNWMKHLREVQIMMPYMSSHISLDIVLHFFLSFSIIYARQLDCASLKTKF